MGTFVHLAILGGLLFPHGFISLSFHQAKQREKTELFGHCANSDSNQVIWSSHFEGG